MSEYDDIPPEDPYESGPAKVDEQLVTEQSVLGGMMLSPTSCTDVLGTLRGIDFSVPRHEVIFDAIRTLHAAGDPTDVIAVTDELIKTGQLQQAGGVEYLHTLTSIVPTAANAGYYASIVSDRASVRTLATIGARLQAGITDPGVTIARALDDLRDLRDGARSTTGVRARTLREVLDVAPEEDVYDWAVPGLLEKRDRLVLTGTEGGGKSTFLRQIAVLSAAGIHPFRFSPIDPVKVLVVDAENSERQWRRAVRDMAQNAAMLGHADPLENVAIHCLTKQIDITRPQDVGMVHRLIDENTPDLLLIGPLYKLVPRSIKDDDDAAPVIAALDSLRDRDVAMLIEAHAGHAQSHRGERDLRPRGSSALLGWPEFGLGISRDREMVHGSYPYSVVRWRGDRDARAWPDRLFRRDRNRPHQTWPWAPAVTI
ncbi:DnaB-like helicase N-terminal domain-containing protein [Microbacterium sp. NPDC058389]|uniref:DnaB-like helicase N-terminal domain-containing protein n=1 Tax=Microbacterium sp. NPDC058389 TaxID=3346475 RepID=UPI003653F345